MDKTEKLTNLVKELEASIKEFILKCPDFPEGQELASKVGKAEANLETCLRFEFDCLELGLPKV